ncbi:hypothetical protein [Candidatus Mycoplasma mahonii]|uniref:hypothetical protein n=1 Tax=Candidatus Mycoplasma mahonii TaxID=3004105 RepID=UPI0026EE98B0|nr:hypothetical protein [Candidatus Mycoplasma mahonii]WKX02762.1 hypothetical protein O3I44_01670 [Candidatus Mycoplasma mahonii]
MAQSIAFHPIKKNTQLCIMDKIEDKIWLNKSDSTDFQNLMNSKDIIKDKLSSIKVIVGISNILRETIGSYFSTKYLLVSDLSQDEYTKLKLVNIHNENKDITKANKFFDQCIRHFKGNVDVNHLLSEFDRAFEKNVLRNLPIIIHLREQIQLLKNKIIGDIVIEEKIDWTSMKSLNEYIINKSFLGTQMRFEIEKKQYYDKRAIKAKLLWESNDEWNLACNELSEDLKKYKKYMVNFLAHVNNVQWSKIIEMPIYKIIKLKEEIMEK